MVWFICQCGDSIKKPKLEKHLFSCGSPSVSCVDCGKTFYGKEYEAHTTCVSEAKKYQGKLFQGEKESGNKGQLKQDNFIDQLAKAVDVAPASLKSHFTKLMEFNNVPRKPKPFKNFAKNSLKLWNDKVLDEMWAVIEEVTKKPPQEDPKKSPQEDPKKAEEQKDKKLDAKDSEEAAKRAPETKDDGRKKRKMNGDSNGFDWTATVEAVLSDAPKQKMKWSDLKEAVVLRYLLTHDAPKGDDGQELLGLQALAAVPIEYVSKEDAFIRQKQ